MRTSKTTDEHGGIGSGNYGSGDPVVLGVTWREKQTFTDVTKRQGIHVVNCRQE